MNTMTRRTFGKQVVIAGGAILAMPAIDGCTVSTAQIVADGQAVATALLAVAKIEAATDPTGAANLTAAANALLAATSGWTTGSTTAIINNAAIVVESVLAAIPQTAAYAPLVAIAVAALDVLLANLPPTAATRPEVTRNPYHGQAHIHHRWGRSPEGDFKAAWNDVCKTNPTLASARQS